MLAKQLKMKQNNKIGEFLGMLLRTLGANLLGNMFARKDVLKAGNGTIIASLDF